MTQGALALVVALVADVAWTAASPGDGRWHAELALRDYDCRFADLCPMLPNLERAAVDGAGHHYRYTTNAAGFRSPEFPPVARADGMLRVQIYGSSPVFGLGVDDGETLPEDVARELAAALPDRGVEVMNLGLPESFFASALSAYVDVGRAYAPDVVVFVQPEVTRLHDLNRRVRQIRASPLLTRLLDFETGQRLVNQWQNGSAEAWHALFGASVADRLRARMAPLVDDQRARGVRVLFFELHGDGHDLAPAVPTELVHAVATTGLTYDAYLASRWVIPGEWHPTAEGDAHFASALAGAIVSLVRGPRPGAD